jgi:hypothetical protein
MANGAKAAGMAGVAGRAGRCGSGPGGPYHCPQNLSPTLGSLISHGAVSPCHYSVYNYTFAAPPPGLVFLPLVRR